MNKYFALFCFFLVVIITSSASYFLGGDIAIYYSELVRPSFSPAPPVFSIVWPILYALIALSGFYAWKEAKDRKHLKASLFIFAINLILNALWTPLFFNLKLPLLAFIEIVILWAIIVVNIVYFYKDSKKAALLMVPYLIWVSFAAVLNYAINLLN